jgi:hypothetical protein
MTLDVHAYGTFDIGFGPMSADADIMKSGHVSLEGMMKGSRC